MAKVTKHSSTGKSGESIDLLSPWGACGNVVFQTQCCAQADLTQASRTPKRTVAHSYERVRPAGQTLVIQ